MRQSLFDPRIKLRHISCMIEVARQGGVVPASRVLGMSQPAVSKSIAELEKILSTQLYDRSRRKLRLTREGEVFAQYAIGAAAALRDGIEKIDSARTKRNSVRIGAMSSVETTLMPRAVAQFLRGPTACNVLIENGSALELLNLLRDGQLDFYAGRLASPDLMDGFVFEKLYSDSVVFVVRPNHPLTNTSTVTFHDIIQHTMILPPRNAIGREIMDALMISGGVSKTKQEIQTLSNGIGRSYVQETDAVWAIARSVVLDDLAHGLLISLPLDTSNSQGAVGIIRRSDDRLSPACKAMIEAIRTEVQVLPLDSS